MKRIIFIILLFALVCFYIWSDNIDLSNDYYDAINKEFFSKDYLGDDDYIYNTFTVAQEESNVIRDEVIVNLVNGNIKLDDGMREIKFLLVL